MAEVLELADRPVIFISGYDRDETVARTLAVGADDYIVKPSSLTELVARAGRAHHRLRPPPSSSCCACSPKAATGHSSLAISCARSRPRSNSMNGEAAHVVAERNVDRHR